MSNELLSLINEARYAQRLCERTARLYRRVQSTATFVTVVSGSAAVTLLAPSVPRWVAIAGLCSLAVFTALNVAMRPAEKAAANESDVKRYAALQTQMQSMTEVAAREALAKAGEADAAEIEPLRDVAFNDVLRETGNARLVLPLKAHQKALAVLA